MTSWGTVVPPSDLAPVAPPLDEGGDAVEYARWSRRVIGALLDHGLLAGISWLTLGENGGVPPFSLPFGGSDASQTPWTHSWVLVVALAVIVGLQAWTGWSPGKLVVGIAVVHDRTGRPLGMVRTLLRWVAHVIDAILLIGYLRPLWHRERRTFADSLVGSVVVRRRPVGLGERREYAVTAAATMLCLAGAALTVTWASWGGEQQFAASCDPQAPAGVADDVARRSGVEATGVEVRHVERRLWMDRVTDLQRSYWADWTWDATTVPVGDLALELTATGPSGAEVTDRLGIGGRSSEVTTMDPQPIGTGTNLYFATVSIGDGAATDLGPVVDLTASFLVDGQVVATCTVHDLEPPPPGN
ncbi:RDD domain containing protein [Xylanimonas cellulosilytica DSM 15894]|uniref:RDD domain containing protein n=1 Tax=Xylanimonas cellulosilytica (strain DSM 15894 / JCM 12276 / CECT 5975 / KCTC 9989 / LMG 20990 / NBRC 107835 / XIL07) TaxID=446471 RepID=D1BTM1_XYLCX|nr:RDD family protein [Xylanimonas cellulosilytica]ACZ31000.1 RDD domain containing protein [Xylanimonas cellulosilytica DSM 15894]